MKLQILIPQYQETDDVVKPLLDSIALQQNVPMEEIGVIICNDGSDVFLSDKLLSAYPFDIQYHHEPHRGVSGTRNACLDYAEADYVMFCDADDMFANVCGLWIMFREMKKGTSPLPAFAIANGLTKIVARPQFIAYMVGKKPLCVKLCEALGAMKVCWTSHDKANEQNYDVVIFERYLPKIKFK